MSDEWLEIYNALVEEISLLTQLVKEYFKGNADIPGFGYASIDYQKKCLKIVYPRRGSYPIEISADNLSEAYKNIDIILDIHELLLKKLKENISKHELVFEKLREFFEPIIIARRLKGERK